MHGETIKKKLITTVETTLCHDTACSNFTYRVQHQMVQSTRNFPHPHNAVQQPACTISHLLLCYGYHQNACRMYHGQISEPTMTTITSNQAWLEYYYRTNIYDIQI